MLYHAPEKQRSVVSLDGGSILERVKRSALKDSHRQTLSLQWFEGLLLLSTGEISFLRFFY